MDYAFTRFNSSRFFFIYDDTWKKEAYKSSTKDKDELQKQITMEIKLISKETLNNVFLNIVKRMNLCISVDGNHFQRLI